MIDYHCFQVDENKKKILKTIEEVQPSEVESSILQANALQTGLNKVLRGRCKVDFAANTPPLVFGTINDRDVLPAAVAGLQKAFKIEGIRRDDRATSLHASLADDEIVAGKEFGKAETPFDELPLLGDIVKSGVVVKPYSGRHRFQALTTLPAVLDKEMRKLSSEMLALENEKTEHEKELEKTDTPAARQKELGARVVQLQSEHESRKELIGRYKGLVRSGTCWVIEIYNKGECEHVSFSVARAPDNHNVL